MKSEYRRYLAGIILAVMFISNLIINFTYAVECKEYGELVQTKEELVKVIEDNKESNKDLIEIERLLEGLEESINLLDEDTHYEEIEEDIIGYERYKGAVASA